MKTRPAERSRLVPHTINGKTEMVLEKYTVDLPIPPRDWDRTVLTAVTAAAGLLVTVAVIWSTASIGDLLARVTIAPAAYAAAVAFDLAWILCMAVEWLARYDPKRATLPRNMGHGALLIAMAAVGAHGWLAGQAVIGIIGAVVSGIVKTLWTVVLRHHAKPLDDKTQQWVDKQRAEAGGELAMVAINRELTRARGQVAAEQEALAEPAREAIEGAPAGAVPELPPPSTELRGAAGTPIEDLSSLRGMHGPIVYFLGNGSRVKIGTTRNLTGRLSALCLRFDNLLCAFHGGHDIESRFHRMFADYRIGGSEWFDIDGTLADFIASQTDDAPGDAAVASGDTSDDAHDAGGDAPQASASPTPLPPRPAGGSK